MRSDFSLSKNNRWYRQQNAACTYLKIPHFSSMRCCMLFFTRDNKEIFVASEKNYYWYNSSAQLYDTC